MNVLARYWSPFHANECVFSRNEQQKVYLASPERFNYTYFLTTFMAKAITNLFFILLGSDSHVISCKIFNNFIKSFLFCYISWSAALLFFRDKASSSKNCLGICFPVLTFVLQRYWYTAPAAGRSLTYSMRPLTVSDHESLFMLVAEQNFFFQSLPGLIRLQFHVFRILAFLIFDGK